MSRLTKAGGAKLRKAQEDDPAAQPAPPVDDGQDAAAEPAPPRPDTTSGKASISAGGNAGEKDSGKASRNRSQKKTPSSQHQRSRQPPRRAGRPKGPDRVPLSVRILAETDARLTTAVEFTGWNPQTIVDRALAEYLDTLGISANGPARTSSGSRTPMT